MKKPSDTMRHAEKLAVALERRAPLDAAARLARHDDDEVKATIPHLSPGFARQLVGLLPEAATWQVTAIGRENVWPLHRRTAELGGNLRTGLAVVGGLFVTWLIVSSKFGKLLIAGIVASYKGMNAAGGP